LRRSIKEVIALSSIKIFSTNEIIVSLGNDRFLKLQIGETYRKSLSDLLGH
jgi:hypothetical protein